LSGGNGRVDSLWLVYMYVKEIETIVEQINAIMDRCGEC
jgi:hypothetical protein